MKYLLFLIILVGCCPIKEGPPGDVQSIEWKQTKPTGKLEIIDCKGGKSDSLDIRTSNVVVQNCDITGYIRIWGQARNGESPVLKDRSHSVGYVNWLRNESPTNVRIINTSIHANGPIPLYVGPGVTNTYIHTVFIDGISVSTMIYLDAESFGTKILNSTIDGTNSPREVIAIDSSDYNVIRDNHIQYVTGGIFLYRNCGEGGVTRHTTPSYNSIMENTFVGYDIAIWLSARDGNRCYCSLDNGNSYGSSISDLDHARYNYIANNTLGGPIVHGKSAEYNTVQKK